jgi:hypothetical protein
MAGETLPALESSGASSPGAKSTSSKKGSSPARARPSSSSNGVSGSENSPGKHSIASGDKARAQSSPEGKQSSPSKGHVHLTAAERLEQITLQINEIRRQRRDVSPEGSQFSKKNKKTNKDKVKSNKKVTREYFHPNLEYVMAEVAYSPYMTSPVSKYSEETLTVTGSADISQAYCPVFNLFFSLFM